MREERLIDVGDEAWLEIAHDIFFLVGKRIPANPVGVWFDRGIEISPGGCCSRTMADDKTKAPHAISRYGRCVCVCLWKKTESGNPCCWCL